MSGRGFVYQHEAVQSLRTAVTTFILASVVGLIPKADGMRPTFHGVIGVAVGFMLLVSLVTMLVASLCFDYSIRFTWNPTEPRKAQKGREPRWTIQETKDIAENTKLKLRQKASPASASLTVYGQPLIRAADRNRYV